MGEILNMTHTCVSLFSGGGGLDLGLEMAGFKTVSANEFVHLACETLRHNFPHANIIEEDIQKVTGKELMAGHRAIDLVCGGPPCQSFTILGQRKSFDDPRGALVFEYVRIIKEIKPKAFIFENVKGLTTVNGGEDWKKLLQYFHDETGYKIYYKVLNSADFGIPQYRERVFIVGFKSHKVEFRFPESTHVKPSSIFSHEKPVYLTVRDAFAPLHDGLTNHEKRIHGERVYNRYKLIPPGGRDKIDHTDRLEWDKPSGTVLVGSSAGGGRPHIHPEEHRHITVREAATLQSFPLEYEFKGGSTAQYRQVGNAVPPLLAKPIGEEIIKALSSVSKKKTCRIEEESDAYRAAV